MNHEDELGERLRAVSMPADLMPAEGFADEALRRRKVGRVRRAVVAGVAVLAVLTGTAAVVSDVTDAAPPVEYPAADVPRPGGGPQVVEGFIAGEQHYLLDRDTGRYLGVPFETYPSPDLVHVGVRRADGRFGFADRDEYLKVGLEAVTWPDDFPQWSGFFRVTSPWTPDGSRFVAALSRGTGEVSGIMESQVTEIAVYDVGTRKTTTTPMPQWQRTTGAAWAADAADFAIVAFDGEIESNTLQLLTPAGDTGGETPLEPERAMLQGFSPDGRYLLYSHQSLAWAAVLDIESGETVSKFDNSGPFYGSLLGWHDATSITRQSIYPRTDETFLERLDLSGEELGERVRWPSVMITSVGSSAGLPAEAAPLGF